VQVEPQFTISFGTRHHDGFRVLYESGGTHYWTHTPYRPSHVIVLPPPPSPGAARLPSLRQPRRLGQASQALAG
jgi:hypothetical protein